MSALRRTATAAVATFAIVLAVPAVGADAASGARHHGRHFQTLATINGAKIQACRIPARPTKPVTMKVRVVGTKHSGKVEGAARAMRGEIYSGRTWTSGWVRPGHTSKVGTVKVPRGGYQLSAGVGTGGMGEGGYFAPTSIRTCR